MRTSTATITRSLMTCVCVLAWCVCVLCQPRAVWASVLGNGRTELLRGGMARKTNMADSRTKERRRRCCHHTAHPIERGRGRSAAPAATEFAPGSKLLSRPTPLGATHMRRTTTGKPPDEKVKTKKKKKKKKRGGTSSSDDDDVGTEAHPHSPFINCPSLSSRRTERYKT